MASGSLDCFWYTGNLLPEWPELALGLRWYGLEPNWRWLRTWRTGGTSAPKESVDEVEEAEGDVMLSVSVRCMCSIAVVGLLQEEDGVEGP